jgi:invasion protein IalB
MLRGIALASLWLVLISTARAEQPPMAAAPSLQRMSLGVWADEQQGQPSSARQGGTRSQCSRWRAVASRLGETYAGHLLRQTVVRRQCRFLEADRVEETWEWPWKSLDDGKILPPRRYAVFADWDIHCAVVGVRRRCALIHRAPLPDEEAPAPRTPAVITHFVIDMVAGRESLLWRVFVPQAPAVVALVSSQAQSDHPGTVRPAQGLGSIGYRLDGADRNERFAACAPAGCLMEAGVRNSGDVATRLWDGRDLKIHIRLGAAEELQVVLPAHGYRAALKELVRLRREERRPSGRR